MNETPSQHWQETLRHWIDIQYGTAGWEQKLENFIADQRKQACREMIEYMKKECPTTVIENGTDNQGMNYTTVKNEPATQAAEDFLSQMN